MNDELGVTPKEKKTLTVLVIIAVIGVLLSFVYLGKTAPITSEVTGELKRSMTLFWGMFLVSVGIPIGYGVYLYIKYYANRKDDF